MWHVSSRSGVATLRTAIHLLWRLREKVIAELLRAVLQDIVCNDRHIFLVKWVVEKPVTSA